jgi:hypothetical protein
LTQSITNQVNFDVETGLCFDPQDGKYTIRVPDYVDDWSYDNMYTNEIKLSPLQLETCLLGVPTHVLVDTRAFVVDGVPDRLLPFGSDQEGYLKCTLWYPSKDDVYVEDHVYLLAHTGEPNSSSFSMIHCDIKWLRHESDRRFEGSWQIYPSIRTPE